MEQHIARLRAIAENLRGKADPASLSEAVCELAEAVADALEDGATAPDFTYHDPLNGGPR